MSSIKKEFFINNRQKLLLEVDTVAPIVLSANGTMQRNNDVTYQFRQDSNFWYLTGLDRPDIILVIIDDDEFLILPSRDDIVKKFDGDDDISSIAKISGIKNIYSSEDGWRKLQKIIKNNKKIATTLAPPDFIERLGIYTNPARKVLQSNMLEINSELEFIDIRNIFAHLRSIKQPIEIEIIKKAIDLTGIALDGVRDNKQKYKYEYEIEADITKIFRSAGFDHAFSPIVASGKSSCTIHHTQNNNPVHKSDLLVLDIGAEVSNYAADITRTISIAKHTTRQQNVYEAVKDVQTYAMGLLKPGIYLKEFELQVEKYMGKKLIELKLISKNDKQEVREYFPHATSHYLGLDTHDVGDYDMPLSPNMVVTCEPGIYIPEEGIGVRIEDDVLITEEGNINLSKNISVRL